MKKLIAGMARLVAVTCAFTALGTPRPENVPELMRTFGGEKVETLEQWENIRAPEILERYRNEVFGVRPKEADERSRVSFTVDDVRDAMDGKAVRKMVTVKFAAPKGEFSFPVTVFIPKSERPVPAFVFICNRPRSNIDADRSIKSDFWPAEEIVARGYATAAFQFCDVAMDDRNAGFGRDVFAAFQDVNERTGNSWAAISAWAWGASRVLDWMETEPLIDAEHVGVVGHSRGGKTAIWTGATDKRFAMVCANNSGCTGARINHINLPKAETIDKICRFTHWFCKNYDKYRGKDKTMDFDQHELLALIAPRLLCVASATEDHWAGQVGEWWGAKLASPAWELYGKKGLVEDAWPRAEKPQQEGFVSYHMRTGNHDLTPYDWGRYMDFADRHGWRSPRAADMDARPETWFHVIGGNASKAGLTADLEALKSAGFGGIQFFHGQFGKVREWDGVEEQIPCLSAKWDDLVRHAADECERLGLSFKMQNCPGWSMSGGPWIAPSNAMRKLVYARKDVNGQDVRYPHVVPEIEIPKECRDADSDWHDICHLAFPTPLGDADGAPLKPVQTQKEGDMQTFSFAAPVTIRTIELPSPRELHRAWPYNPAARVRFEAETTDGWKTVCDTDYPQGCWQEGVPFSLACDEATAKNWRLTVSSSHHQVTVRRVRLFSGARLDNWEGLAGHVLRGQLKRPAPRQSAASYIPVGSVRVVKPGERLPEGRRWTVLRVGHVNMKMRNAPAPKAATGWECDKLDPRGIEANFAGYIGRLVKGPLAGGKLKGMIVDSWECQRQTWTWRMEEYFSQANGYDVKTILPAVFGWVIGSPAETERLLLDWRRTVSGLVTRNYYGRMAELAHAAGLSVAYETAFGDVVPGDLLEFWKYCDTPMCEFWQPYTPLAGSVGHPNFKPVRPCVSAAHLYGKRRVACESFTNMRLTWNENFRDLKEQAVRHFARGVTHFVFHTYTHQPQTDGRVPGSSFGSFIGTPFIRGETWWPFMRPFTDWIAACGTFLERGMPVVDALRYLGDELDHKPDELEYFPEGFKNDYLNADVLFNRLDVKDGRFVLPDGLSYAVIWVPKTVMLLPKTRARLDALAAKGGRIVYGSADEAVVGLERQLSYRSSATSATPPPALLWYHQRDGAADCFFVGADEKGFDGQATFRTQRGERTLALDLAPYETLLLEFGPDGVKDLAPASLWKDEGADKRAAVVPARGKNVALPGQLSTWTLAFPSGWGAPAHLALDRLVPWKDLPGVSDEGRAFSGTATYSATWMLPADFPKPLLLDLGDVRDFARVFVNGREVAALWAGPYRCDVAPFVKPGTNEIKVEVTSTWFNRLAYDFNQPPSTRKTWTIWDIATQPPPCLKPNAALMESGLLGPVTMHTRKTQN